MKKVYVPTYDTLMNPLIKALKDLGGSGTIEEIATKVVENSDLTDEQLEVLHNPEKRSNGSGISPGVGANIPEEIWCS
jgi:restriction system protein